MGIKLTSEVSKEIDELVERTGFWTAIAQALTTIFSSSDDAEETEEKEESC